MVFVSVHFFFFQAEDGIRDRNVTGVQTCALPICSLDRFPSAYLAVRTAAFRKIISTRFGFRLSSFDRRASGCVLKTGSRRREKADFGAENTSASLPDRKSTRLNSSHVSISYAVFC